MLKRRSLTEIMNKESISTKGCQMILNSINKNLGGQRVESHHKNAFILSALFSSQFLNFSWDANSEEKINPIKF